MEPGVFHERFLSWVISHMMPYFNKDPENSGGFWDFQYGDSAWI